MTSPASDDLSKRVIRIIADAMEIPLEEISVSSTFEELGIDSLGGLTIVGELEDAFNLQIPNEKALQIANIPEMLLCLRELIACNETEPHSGSTS